MNDHISLGNQTEKKSENWTWGRDSSISTSVMAGNDDFERHIMYIASSYYIAVVVLELLAFSVLIFNSNFTLVYSKF